MKRDDYGTTSGGKINRIKFDANINLLTFVCRCGYYTYHLQYYDTQYNRIRQQKMHQLVAFLF